MGRARRPKNGRLTEAEVELFCLSVEETLKKIHERCVTKEGRKKRKAKVSHQYDYSDPNEKEEEESLHTVG